MCYVKWHCYWCEWLLCHPKCVTKEFSGHLWLQYKVQEVSRYNNPVSFPSNMGCVDHRWENRLKVFPQQAATLWLQCKYISIHHSQSFFPLLPFKSALVPKGWCYITLLNDIFISAILQKLTKMFHYLWINLLSTRYLTVAVWICKVDISSEPTGCQWASGRCTVMKNVHSKSDAWHFQMEKVNDMLQELRGKLRMACDYITL